MKQLLFLAFLLVLLPACEDDRAAADGATVETTAAFAASSDQATSDYTPLYIHNIPAPERINGQSTRWGAFGQILVPDMTKFEPTVLTKNLWIFEFYVDNLASPEQKKAGTGQWLRFNPNGTFIGGHWERQTHAGAWYMDYQHEYPRLTLDSNVDMQDAIWEVQGVNGNQDAMSWRRIPNGDFGPKRKSVLCKLIEGYDRPTKEQFADFLNTPTRR